MHHGRDDDARLQADLAAIAGLPVFVAYNANVDAIVRVDADLEGYLERPPAPGEQPPPPRLESTRDLATAITHTMALGRGNEAAMADALAATLEAELTPDAQQMGGQAGIMTNLLTALGAAPITYTYLVSERQRALFTAPEAVRYPVVEDGAVSFVPIDVTADRTKINWVFEFGVGDEIFDVSAIAGTRFIAASRPPEFNLIAGELDERIDQIGAQVEGALLAGYHNLTPEHVEEGYDETLRHARDVLRRFRAGDDPTVHIEYAVTQDETLRRGIYEWILPEADVIGADTHELSLMTDDAGLALDVEEPTERTPFAPEEILAHYRMLSALREDLGVGCIRLHAMQYHLAVMEGYRPPEAVRRGLEFAAINAATKADRGDIVAPEDLETGLTYEPSAKGSAAIDLLAEHVGEPTDGGTLAAPTVVACPNRVVEEPAGTVGIGDVVSASSFVLEIATDGDDG